ncbi:type II toxin-antitoxin system PemK/MazF family toxin [Egibacter rhizosphaerae]|uniref:mRNA interferase n=1 Tax=Egibacter rhizosphaerae TaxID=1670831 RepID=A0A411YBG4_9ACTN|nr:type II toxin-antitoxin system PemK/MazF family toxin [Egibacter rhizosphaerae]QBI18512.1 type II toxin-antitoxin system PemK/MazF family toxin [Egibacter rhizosphaerae]
MPTSGDVVEVDLGVPAGAEAGLRRPAVIVTADRVLLHRPSVVQVVPVSSTVRGYATEVTVPADPTNGLDVDSAAQCQHLRAVASQRIDRALGNVGPVTLAQVRDTIATLLDL